MLRRCLIAVAVVVVGVMPGCGLGVRKKDEESFKAAVTVPRNFPEPPHRVAVAAFEVMRAELASAEFAGDSEFSPAPLRPKPDGSKPTEAEVRLPPGAPVFWVEWKNREKTVTDLVALRACHYKGQTRDRRPVTVDVLNTPEGSLVTVLIDKLGDRMASNALLDRIADPLAHAASPPGSPEEAVTLKAFFGGVESREALPTIRKKGDQAG